jgi:hypothetical protein
LQDATYKKVRQKVPLILYDISNCSFKFVHLQNSSTELETSEI